MQLIGEALCHNSSLRVLDIRSNKASVGGAAGLAAACSQNSTRLTSLQLSCNHIGDCGACSFASLFASANSKVEKLNLSSNGLTDRSVVTIAKSLAKGDTALASLSVCDNSLSGKAVAALGMAAAKHQALTELILNDNAIGDAGAMALAPHLSHLHRLQLAGCQIQEAGGLALASHLAATKHQIKIDLSRNQIGCVAKKALVGVCACRSWSWEKERVLWMGYYDAKLCSVIGRLDPELMARVVALCRNETAKSSTALREAFPIVVRINN